ncbi:MAG: hypothetical protein Q7T05_07215 [Dehalococcoidia bacterium]|nr:hypothetical protein [Dehalococcoidia bacterium]
MGISKEITRMFNFKKLIPRFNKEKKALPTPNIVSPTKKEMPDKPK